MADAHEQDNHRHDRPSELSETHVRVRALETILVEKGYLDSAALEVLIETYETKIGPHNGARVVAKAWVDQDYRRWLFAESSAAIASLAYATDPAECCATSALSCRRIQRSGCGIRQRKCVTSSCRCGPQELTAGTKTSWPALSLATQ